MIHSFSNRNTERLYNGVRVAAFQSFARQARRKLNDLDEAGSLIDLQEISGNHLETLTGNRQGQHSIRINRQWRICFRWSGNGAHDVEIVDYH